jgi:hypothetical protein
MVQQPEPGPLVEPGLSHLRAIRSYCRTVCDEYLTCKRPISQDMNLLTLKKFILSRAVSKQSSGDTYL